MSISADNVRAKVLNNGNKEIRLYDDEGDKIAVVKADRSEPEDWCFLTLKWQKDSTFYGYEEVAALMNLHGWSLDA